MNRVFTGRFTGIAGIWNKQIGSWPKSRCSWTACSQSGSPNSNVASKLTWSSKKNLQLRISKVTYGYCGLYTMKLILWNWLALENDLLHFCTACIHFLSARDDYHGTWCAIWLMSYPLDTQSFELNLSLPPFDVFASTSRLDHSNDSDQLRSTHTKSDQISQTN